MKLNYDSESTAQENIIFLECAEYFKLRIENSAVFRAFLLQS